MTQITARIREQMNINLVQANHGFGENGGGDVEEVPQGLKPAVIFTIFGTTEVVP